MAVIIPPKSNTESGIIKVWDLPVRLFHWTLVVLFAMLWGSGRMGRLDIHLWVGQTMLALLLFRLTWGVLGSATARFSSFLHGPGAILRYLAGRGSAHSGIGHNPLGGWSAAVMLTALLIQTACGLFATDDIATDGPLVWMVSSRTTKLLSTLHRLDCWILLGLVALHLGAIAFYRFAKGDNLIRPMIVGTKAIGAGPKAQPPRMASSRLALALAALAGTLVFGSLAIWGR